MSKMTISVDFQHSLLNFLKKTKHPELISAYFFYVEKKFRLEPVLFVRDKLVFQSVDDALRLLGQEDKLVRETEIKIGYDRSSVNDQTKKVYICPFSGKVFGDNTHPNPQDAIYDWVSKCPENKERSGGVRVKRFFVSDDPEVIKEYARKDKPKELIVKTVFSSAINGKLFHSKEAVIDDFKQNYLKRVSLQEVQSQNRFQIEEHFMEFIQKQLADDKIASFVESLAEVAEFGPYVEEWLGEVDQES